MLDYVASFFFFFVSIDIRIYRLTQEACFSFIMHTEIKILIQRNYCRKYSTQQGIENAIRDYFLLVRNDDNVQPKSFLKLI